MIELAGEEFAKELDQMIAGCFVFVVELPNGDLEALAMHKFEYAVSTMISKESALSL